MAASFASVPGVSFRISAAIMNCWMPGFWAGAAAIDFVRPAAWAAEARTAERSRVRRVRPGDMRGTSDRAIVGRVGSVGKGLGLKRANVLRADQYNGRPDAPASF